MWSVISRRRAFILNIHHRASKNISNGLLLDKNSAQLVVRLMVAVSSSICLHLFSFSIPKQFQSHNAYLWTQYINAVFLCHNVNLWTFVNLHQPTKISTFYSIKHFFMFPKFKSDVFQPVVAASFYSPLTDNRVFRIAFVFAWISDAVRRQSHLDVAFILRSSAWFVTLDLPEHLTRNRTTFFVSLHTDMRNAMTSIFIFWSMKYRN